MDLRRLRQATEPDHQAVENTVPLMHAGLTKTEYIDVLQQMYGIVAAWEDRAAQIAPPWLLPAIVARQRRPLLEQDLRFFGITHFDSSRPNLPPASDLPSLLGVMYVMEGSALGGQFIARHVEAALHLTDGQGNAYFRGHGTQTGSMWKDFCEILATNIPDDQTDTVIAAAKAMFATFGQWMQQKSVLHAQ